MVQTFVQGEEIGIAGTLVESGGNIRTPLWNAMRHALRAAGWRAGGCWAGGCCAGWIGGEGA